MSVWEACSLPKMVGPELAHITSVQIILVITSHMALPTCRAVEVMTLSS